MIDASTQTEAHAPTPESAQSLIHPPPATPVRSSLPPGALGAWWWQGTRSAFLLKPDWSGLRATPAMLACLFILPVLIALLSERLYIPGPAHFYWQGLASGWIAPVLVLWACWIVVRSRPANGAPLLPDTASLFAMTCAQALPLAVGASLLFIPLMRSGLFVEEDSGVWVGRIAWFATLGWLLCAPAVLLARSGAPRWWPRAFAVVFVTAALFVDHWVFTTRHWYPAPAVNAGNGAEPARLQLTQQVMEQQAEVLRNRLQALAAQRAGVIDVYVLTFAPYAEQDVFRRESDMVGSVMKQRFDAEGRTLELMNHRATAAQWPWATPLNLERAIRRIGALMDRDEDVLFIHLTSHGAGNGALSASFWPIEVASVTPQMLKNWLDEAGIRNRVISVSACYSGTWIAPLAETGTLVMTASDSEHTSYGCGSKSELTFFGRAMYDEGMRTTWSFEDAHARARTAIAQREQAAGKRDGYSNPQISMGESIRARLRLLETQRAAAVH